MGGRGGQSLLMWIAARALKAPLSDDPWAKRPAKVPLSRFGPGCVHEWPWYFEGVSNVRVRPIEDLCAWLRKSRYAHDIALFQEQDFWQHPATFEATRKGDCEDHAIWAWRKLSELGFPAELVCGKTSYVERPEDGGHAWVVFVRNQRPYVLETCAKSGKRQMILSMRRARDLYCPRVSVDLEFQTYVYAGCLRPFRNLFRRADPRRT